MSGGRRVSIPLALAAACLWSPIRGACPCLPSNVTIPALSDYINGAGELEYEGEVYPSDYGAAACDMHDSALGPYCADSNGNARDGRPEWCEDTWCWVDDNDCDSAVVTKSAYFPSSGLHFSYSTCGSENTFSAWFVNNTGTYSIDELAEVVENYAFSIRDHIESDLADISQRSGCVTNDCSCGGDCEEREGWGDTAVHLGSTIFKDDAGEEATDFSRCMSRVAASVFMRVAGLEYTDATRPGFLYAGFQEDGAYIQWPRQNWCSDFDPRFRPWFAAAASAPKNVVVVVDVSGSMSESGRIDLARAAVAAIVDTLTWKDHVTVIQFNDSHEVYSDRLVRITDDERVNLKVYAENLRAAGGTAFTEPLDRALSILEAAETGACHNVILMMTDGQAVFTDAQFEQVRERTLAEDVIIFTYALGSGADTAVTQRLACENRGVAHTVPDNADLASAMSSYYTYFTAGTGYRGARWVRYTDITIGADLLAACTAIYDTRGENSELNVLLGVACMDVNVIVSLETLEARDDVDDFMARVNAASDTCGDLFGGDTGEALEQRLEDVRARLESEGGTLCGSTAEQTGGAGNSALVGIIVGAVAGVILLLACAYCTFRACRRTAKPGGPSSTYSNTQPPARPQQQAPPPAYAASPSVPVAQGVPVGVSNQPVIVQGTVVRVV